MAPSLLPCHIGLFILTSKIIRVVQMSISNCSNLLNCESFRKFSTDLQGDMIMKFSIQLEVVTFSLAFPWERFSEKNRVPEFWNEHTHTHTTTSKSLLFLDAKHGYAVIAGDHIPENHSHTGMLCKHPIKGQRSFPYSGTSHNGPSHERTTSL